MRVVVDTNVLISWIINPEGVPARLVDFLEPIGLLSSELLLSEFERVLHYPRIQQKYALTEEKIEGYLGRMRRASELVNMEDIVEKVTRDPDDDRFLVCAFAGGADYVVSGDSHLLEIVEYHGIPIVNPATMVRLLEETSD